MQRHSCPGAAGERALSAWTARAACTSVYNQRPPPPLPLYFREVEAVHIGRTGRDRHTGGGGGRGLWPSQRRHTCGRTGGGGRTGWPAGPRCAWIVLRQRLHLGGERARGDGEGRAKGGRRAGGGGKGGFTTHKRVGIPPEPFPHLAGSCENNSLALTLLVPLFLWCSLLSLSVQMKFQL